MSPDLVDPVEQIGSIGILDPLQDAHSGFLENPQRWWVVGVHCGEEPLSPQGVQPILAQGPRDLGGVPVPPLAPGEDISQLEVIPGSEKGAMTHEVSIALGTPSPKKAMPGTVEELREQIFFLHFREEKDGQYAD